MSHNCHTENFEISHPSTRECKTAHKLLKKLTKGSYDLSLKDDIHMNTFRDSLRRNFKLLGDTATTTRLYVTAEESEIQPEIRTQQAYWYFTGKPTQYDQAESISKVLCRAVLPHFQHAETRTASYSFADQADIVPLRSHIAFSIA